MKAYRYSLIGVYIFLVIGVANAQIERTKELNRTFKANNSTSLSIENKYGEVHIQTWDRNEIKVDIKVTVDKRSESRAREVLDQIDFDISESSSAVSIETEIDGSINTGRNDKLSIDYKIMMPKANPLSVSNKYGSFYLDHFEGKLNLEIKYGNMKVEDVSGRAEIELAYGAGEIESLKNGKLDISYSSLSVGRIGNMEVSSKYSKVNFDKTGDILLENKYGDINIGEAESLQGEVKYGGMRVDKLNNSLVLDMKYGSGVHVDWISNDFELVQIRSGYAGSSLKFEPGFTAKFTGNFKYCHLKYPEKDFDFNVIHEGNNSSEYRGVFGKGSPKSKISINSAYGNVKIGYTD